MTLINHKVVTEGDCYKTIITELGLGGLYQEIFNCYIDEADSNEKLNGISGREQLKKVVDYAGRKYIVVTRDTSPKYIVIKVK